MTEQDIKGNFLAIQNLVTQLAGADLPDAEREAVKVLVTVGLNLLEGLLLDINRIANCAEMNLDQHR